MAVAFPQRLMIRTISKLSPAMPEMIMHVSKHAVAFKAVQIITAQKMLSTSL